MKKLLIGMLLLALLLTGCGKDKPAEQNVTEAPEFYRTIQVEDFQGVVDVTRDGAPRMAAYNGLTFADGDRVSVGEKSELMLTADSDKHVYAEEDTVFRMEAEGAEGSTRTRIHLEQGSILCRLDNKLGASESFEVETPAAILSVRGTVFRVSLYTMKDCQFTMVQVFEGTVVSVISDTMESVTLRSGQCALIRQDNSGKAVFVLDDEINQEFWKDNSTSWFEVNLGGSGSPVLSVPYEKLPRKIQLQLIAMTEEGQTLEVSPDLLRNLIETGHNYESTVISVASCKEEGITSLVCTICGATSQKVEPKKEHSVVTDAAIKASCARTGKTEGSHCSVCSTIIVPQKAIPTTAHTEVADAAVAATCTKTGLTRGTHCSVCRTVLTPQKEVPKLAHTPENDAAVAATCTQDGKTAGTHCKVCKTVLTEQTVVKATGHTETTSKNAQDPTCTQPGKTAEIKCSKCNTILREQTEVEKVPHTEAVDAAVAPTCSAAGKTAGKHCSVCSTVLVAQETVPIDPEAHGEVVSKPGVVPTCTKPGMTDEKVCIYCSALLQSQVELPVDPEGHVVVVDPAVTPTCKATGLTEGSHCSECSKILTAQELLPVDPDGHVAAVDAAVAPTCVASGLTAGSHCSECGITLTAQETVPADPDAHSPVESAPSFGVDGCCARYDRSCGLCGAELEPRIVAEHTPVPVPNEERGGDVLRMERSAVDEEGSVETITALLELNADCICSLCRTSQSAEPMKVKVDVIATWSAADGTLTITHIGGGNPAFEPGHSLELYNQVFKLMLAAVSG